MFDQNKAIVRRWLDMVVGDQDAVSESYRTLDPALSWTLIGSTAISGTFCGLDAINDVFQQRCWHGDGRGSGRQGLDPAYGIKLLAVRDIVALEDGRIMVHCFSDGMGKNGIAYRNEYCWLVTVTGHRISGIYEFADTALIEQVIFDKRIVAAEHFGQEAAE